MMILEQDPGATLKLKPVTDHVESTVGRYKLLEKIGFRREGLQKKDVFFRKDESGEPLWTDTLVYAMLAEEGAHL